MSLSSIDATYETFLANIALTESQTERIDGALAALSGLFLTKYEGNVEIYVQGSFATSTTVKPLTDSQSEYGPGEFDIDIVLERADWTGAEDALKEIENVLQEFDKYASRISSEKKESCVRLEYAPDQATGVGFHVDIVPIKVERSIRKVAVRTPDFWKESDSLQLIEWTKKQQSDKPYLTATVLSIKRLRDMAGLTTDLTSIVMFSLLKESYAQTGSYADDLLGALHSISQQLPNDINSLSITNPINVNEDIIGKWRDEPSVYTAIKSFFDTSAQTLSLAFTNHDVETIRILLSNDFPPSLEPVNVRSMRAEGVVVSGYADIKNGLVSAGSKFGQKTSASMWTFFERDKSIAFHAYGADLDERILWQVCNDPKSDSIRGEFFQARAFAGGFGSSTDPRKNWENERYAGTHWIRFVGINNQGELATISPKFYVRVHALGTGFRK